MPGRKNIPERDEINIRLESGMNYTMVCPDIHRAIRALYLESSAWYSATALLFGTASAALGLFLFVAASTALCWSRFRSIRLYRGFSRR